MTELDPESSWIKITFITNEPPTFNIFLLFLNSDITFFLFLTKSILLNFTFSIRTSISSNTNLKFPYLPS